MLKKMVAETKFEKRKIRASVLKMVVETKFFLNEKKKNSLHVDVEKWLAIVSVSQPARDSV